MHMPHIHVPHLHFKNVVKKYRWRKFAQRTGLLLFAIPPAVSVVRNAQEAGFSFSRPDTMLQNLTFAIGNIPPSAWVVGTFLGGYIGLWLYGQLNGDHHAKKFEADKLDACEDAHAEANNETITLWQKAWRVWRRGNETHITRGTRMVNAGIGAGIAFVAALERKTPGTFNALVNTGYEAAYDVVIRFDFGKVHDMTAAAATNVMHMTPDKWEALAWAGSLSVGGSIAAHIISGVFLAPPVHAFHALWNHGKVWWHDRKERRAAAALIPS